MLQATALKKTFYQGVTNHVINGVDLEIEERQFVTITGKSGSGKSTLLYLLSGLEKPTSGSVMFHNQILHKLNDKAMSKLRRHSFGFVFQFFNLVSALSVWDNICLPVTIERRVNSAEKAVIHEYIKMLGLEDKISSYPHHLSGGQQQRVAIARALAIDPDIIFADEPTGNLDSETSDDVLQVFHNLNKSLGKTVVIVTHDETITSMFSAREVHLVNGKIVNRQA